jgi:vacuolar-type H+-ATPase subunit H
MKETEDVAKAQQRVTLAQQELAALQQQIEEEATEVSGTTDTEIEAVEIKPKRGSVDVRLVALAWIPT